MNVGTLSDGSSSIGPGESIGGHTVSAEKLSERTEGDRVMDTMTTASHFGGTGEGRKTTTVSVDMQPNKKRCRSEDPCEQLFPRLPDEITFCRIVPKLPWRAFHILAAVSRNWRKAIQSHRVYNARMHSCSTDTLVVHGHRYSKNDVRIAKLSVHSVRDNLCYELPPIPGQGGGVPSSCECVSLDGKIYVLGGGVDVCPTSDSISKVYVLDLAGASHWKECARMERGRQKFGCGVIDGKIFVFGGTCNGQAVRGAEVYDPKVNRWSPIMPMPYLRSCPKVCTLGGKIVVYDGMYYGEDYTDSRSILGLENCALEWSGSMRVASFLEEYHPGKDEWTLESGYSQSSANMFMVEGKFHVMEEDAIYLTDDPAHNTTWEQLQVNLFPRIGRIECLHDHFTVTPRATVVLNDELLAGVDWVDRHDRRNVGSALLQSKGFGTENTKIGWKVVSYCAGAFDFMHCIQL